MPGPPDSPAQPAPPSSPLAALRAWRETLGEAHVRADAEAVARYARTTAPGGPPPGTAAGLAPGAVLFPASTDEVRRVLEIAGRFGVPLHPISRGKNWGYGDAAPPRGGQVVVDLRRMDRILEINEPLAYAVIEAGVTQGQLHEHLRRHHPKLWMDSTGAGLGASLLGNTLDRGFGHTPVGDHFANTCGMQVVLPDARVLETGFGHFRGAAAGEAAHATHAYRYGVGPILDGLFSQSNLGIVTRAGVWLMPAPEDFAAFFVAAPRDTDLADLVDRLARLRLTGLLRSAVHVANDLRVFSSRIAYPLERTGGATPIPPDLRRELAREAGCGAWNVSGGMYGTRATVAATRRAIREALAGTGYRLIFLDDRRLAMARRVLPRLAALPWARKQAELLGVVEPAYQLLKGVPTDEFLRGVLWRVPPERLRGLGANPSLDPLDHGVGLVWVSPVVPATGEHARRVVDLLAPIYARHGFDFLATLTLITERALCCVTNFTFDRADEAESERAAACYDACLAALLAAGYPPYRTGPSGYARLRREGDVFWEVCREIKGALDPRGIVSPGRYIS